MSYKHTFNQFTGERDKILNAAELVGYDGTSSFYFKENGYTVELWYRDVLVQSWTTSEPTTGVGQPMGLLLTLTYAS